MPKSKLSLIERFEDKIFYSPDGCHYFWGSPNPQGYGNIRCGNKTVRAHRLSYLMHKGPIGKFDVLHICDNPPCVNPNHLFLGDDFDNVRDKIRKGRANTVRGSNRPNAKLNESQVLEIRSLKGKVPASAIGRKYGVTTSCIEGVLYRNNWKHI